MCGIVGVVAQRNVIPVLVDGLRRLEYRGYDSAGVAVQSEHGLLERVRKVGKVAELSRALDENPVSGHTGIAHTRWATHGMPSEQNAHPHVCHERVALVHNGIIENHDELREQQRLGGYRFTSQTDTEVIVHQIHLYLDRGQDLLAAVQSTVADLDGAFALGVISKDEPGRLVAARRGSPLVIGIADGEMLIASDVAALISETSRFIFLEEGDVADIGHDSLVIYDHDGRVVEREVQTSKVTLDATDKGEFEHYMLKEIYEQPRAIADTLEGRIGSNRVLEEAFGSGAGDIFENVRGVHIIACGTSYHAGMVGRYWLESLAGIPCSVEVASEFRYRNPVVRNNSLIVTLSQSGETADTLSGLREARRLGFGHSLSICNVPESSLVRESDLVLMTHAGPEIGVASTKAFTTQLVAMLLLTIVLGRRHGMTPDTEISLVNELRSVPGKVEHALELSEQIRQLAKDHFADKNNALFLGRGDQYPVAMEGALKLKEISYIHAEAYPAGELKHGPLALVDESMPVVVVAPNNQLLEKLKSNLQEVRARGGKLIVFADTDVGIESSEDLIVLPVAPTEDSIAPIIFSVPLQLLAYHVAALKGTDIDQPRNLAKSVTVE
ncbi:MAG TPA: glutamine--fructose-6-phosphate transaminase (isomerizing) [Gammaproteobacteria bacterium]|jgi:glucosamine--fructose-6-phosphate aminotransferase (isomerizing)|nr:glutamine--fructose-6-phosphate transaminase (isomerizing) [Gammaproteobacteria bacterium]